MSTTTSTTGNAERNGMAWGARARDWSETEAQQVPTYADDSFDAVCGFNAFYFADDMVAALREAGRVAKPGAPVVIQVWGRPEAFGLRHMKDTSSPASRHRGRLGGSIRPRCGSPGCSRASRPRRASCRTASSTSSGPTSTRTRRS